MTRGVARRTVLRTAGAALAAGVAGCSTALPPLGRRVRFGRVDVPASDPPRYRNWMPRPEALQTAERGGPYPSSHVLYVRPGHGKHVIGFTLGRGMMASGVDYLGMGFDTYDWAVTVGNRGLVLRGSVDVATVDETLTETVYERNGSYRGFDLYRRRDLPKAVAVSDTHVVSTSGGSATANARAIVDAGRGRAPRHHETDEARRLITDVAGARPFVWIGPTLFAPTYVLHTLDAEPIVGAMASDADGEAAYLSHHGLYPRGDVPTRAEVERLLAQTDHDVYGPADVDVEIDERVVSVELRLPIDELPTHLAPENERYNTPQVTWKTTHDTASETFVIHHVAGDVIDSSSLEVEAGEAEFEIAGSNGTFGPGDRIRIDVSRIRAGERVIVVYNVPESDASGTLFVHDFTAEQAAGASNQTRGGPA